MKRTLILAGLIAALIAALLLIAGCTRPAPEGGDTGAPDTAAPQETLSPADTSAPATAEPQTAVPETEAPKVPPTLPPQDREIGFSRYGRSPRLPEYLGPALYADYRTLMDALYEGRAEARLEYCASNEDFSKAANCIKLMFLPKDLLRDPGSLTVTPFEFDPETSEVRIFYCWDDETLEPEDLPCTGPEDYMAQLGAFEENVEGILRECVSDFGSEAKNAKALFDWVAGNFYYEINRSDTAFTALRDHRAYCSLYAEAYRFLAEEAGVECMLISGATNSGWGDHEWDLVRLDGCWYHLDATFQGSDNYADGYFFGMSDRTCVALGHGNSSDFSLSDELTGFTAPPECGDGAFDRIYRPWL